MRLPTRGAAGGWLLLGSVFGGLGGGSRCVWGGGGCACSPGELQVGAGEQAAAAAHSLGRRPPVVLFPLPVSPAHLPHPTTRPPPPSHPPPPSAHPYLCADALPDLRHRQPGDHPHGQGRQPQGLRLRGVPGGQRPGLCWGRGARQCLAGLVAWGTRLAGGKAGRQCYVGLPLFAYCCYCCSCCSCCLALLCAGRRGDQRLPAGQHRAARAADQGLPQAHQRPRHAPGAGAGARPWRPRRRLLRLHAHAHAPALHDGLRLRLCAPGSGPWAGGRLLPLLRGACLPACSRDLGGRRPAPPSEDGAQSLATAALAGELSALDCLLFAAHFPSPA